MSQLADVNIQPSVGMFKFCGRFWYFGSDFAFIFLLQFQLVCFVINFPLQSGCRVFLFSILDRGLGFSPGAGGQANIAAGHYL